MTDSQLTIRILEFLSYLQDREIFLCTRDEKRVFEHVDHDELSVLREAYIANKGEL